MNVRGAQQLWHPAIAILAIGLACAPARIEAAPGRALAKYHLKIASQPLDEALQEFARQSGIQIIYFSRLTQGLQAPGLYGEYTLSAAMSALLAESKLTFRVINPKTVEIRPLPAASLLHKASALPVTSNFDLENRE